MVDLRNLRGVFRPTSTGWNFVSSCLFCKNKPTRHKCTIQTITSLYSYGRHVGSSGGKRRDVLRRQSWPGFPACLTFTCLKNRYNFSKCTLQTCKQFPVRRPIRSIISIGKRYYLDSVLVSGGFIFIKQTRTRKVSTSWSWSGNKRQQHFLFHGIFRLLLQLWLK